MVFGNRQYNSPSRFITEMDNHFLDFQGGAPQSYAPRYPDVRTRPQGASYSRAMHKSRPLRENKSVVGRLVEHEEMGRGVVIEENGDILTVAFRARGIKKVARNYIKFID